MGYGLWVMGFTPYLSPITYHPSPITYPFGGGERVRTDGLLRARQALSQLSYTPDKLQVRGYGLWVRGLLPRTSYP